LIGEDHIAEFVLHDDAAWPHAAPAPDIRYFIEDLHGPEPTGAVTTPPYFLGCEAGDAAVRHNFFA
jgi:hypothetical protein